jgi:polyisoprenoid-binding protein YceI
VRPRISIFSHQVTAVSTTVLIDDETLKSGGKRMNTRKSWALGLGLLIGALPLYAAKTETITLDPAKSTIKWVGKKVTGQHDGTIQLKSGKAVLEDGQLKGGEFVVDMKSLAVSDLTDAGANAKLTGHLKSDDFFGVDKHPTATFVIKKVTPITMSGASMNNHEVTGDLMIKGKTASLTFPAAVSIGPKSAQANATITVDRTLYDVRFGSTKFFDKLGDKAIHDNFTLDVHLEGSR